MNYPRRNKFKYILRTEFPNILSKSSQQYQCQLMKLSLIYYNKKISLCLLKKHSIQVICSLLFPAYSQYKIWKLSSLKTKIVCVKTLLLGTSQASHVLSLQVLFFLLVISRSHSCLPKNSTAPSKCCPNFSLRTNLKLALSFTSLSLLQQLLKMKMEAKLLHSQSNYHIRSI